jgi:hypothetical protein
MYYLRNCFSLRSLETFDSLQIIPCYADRPLERSCPLQLGPWAPAGGTPAEFRRTGGRVRPGAGGERPEGPWGWIPPLWRGGGRTSDGPRRRTRAAAAGACRPARGGARRARGWRLEPLGILEGVSEGSVDCGCKRRWSSLSGGHGGRRQGSACEGKQAAPIYRHGADAWLHAFAAKGTPGVNATVRRRASVGARTVRGNGWTGGTRRAAD